MRYGIFTPVGGEVAHKARRHCTSIRSAFLDEIRSCTCSTLTTTGAAASEPATVTASSEPTARTTSALAAPLHLRCCHETTSAAASLTAALQTEHAWQVPEDHRKRA